MVLASNKTVLLTGATGFLGSHILEAFLAADYRVVILKRSTSDIRRVEHLLGKAIVHDIDIEPLETVFEDQVIDFVVHTATDYGRGHGNEIAILECNLFFSLRLLELAKQYGVKCFINTDTFFNTSSKIQSHLRTYTVSKRQFVEWLKLSEEKINIANMKLHHVYGEHDDKRKFVPWLLRQLRENKSKVELTEGSQLRDFIYVKDVVSAYLKIIENIQIITGYNDFIVSSGNKTSLRTFCTELYYQTKAITNTSTHLVFGARPTSADEIMDIDNDNENLRKLDWLPLYSIETGLKAMLSKELHDS